MRFEKDLAFKQLHKFLPVLLIGLFTFIGTSIIGFSFAQSQANNTINSCVGNGVLNNGRVRIIDENESCNFNEDPLDWQSGVKVYYESFDLNRDNGGEPLFLNDDGSVVPVLSIENVPTGDYLVSVTGYIGDIASCSFNDSDFNSSEITPWTGATNTQNIYFTDVINHDQTGDLTLYCTQANPQSGGMEAYKIAITATPLEALVLNP